MSKTTINYGNQQLTLTKSDNLVAVKATAGMNRQLELTMSKVKAQYTGQTLQGFSIIQMEDVPEKVNEMLDVLRTNPSVSVGSHVYYTSDDEVPFVPTGQLYVVFKEKAPTDECQNLIDKHQLQIVEARGERELIVQVTPGSQNPVKVAASLQSSDLVEVAEPDLATPGKMTGFMIPSDSLIDKQWHLHNTGFHRGTSFGFKKGADARVFEAWQLAETLGSPTVVVAVIDDGFDLAHPDLAGSDKIVAPWDFTRNSADPTPEFGPTYPYWDPWNQQWVGDWHGTACVGVAVGNANDTGIVGAAPNSRLMPVRWGPDLSDTQLEKWFDYVRIKGAWVVSCSWGAAARNFTLSTRAKSTIERCAREGRNGLGCVICFAAGNENRNINDPNSGSVNGFAIHPDVIAVSAITSRDQKSNYSNYGKEISVCAPSNGAGGWGITTSDVTGTFLRMGQQIASGYNPGAYTDSFGGTSSACPLVAGICALILSIKPQLSSIQVKDLIQRTARHVGNASDYDNNGHSIKFGYGCINAEHAIKMILTGDN
ncbi:peptidase S8 and S53 subtilisin kexin sedolisin [Candidatus Poribacteria bacterium]|nr:peptidase S8 and S53 subtilisin kexin sedolisin [Candidatus Poribacteria bacterium]